MFIFVNAIKFKDNIEMLKHLAEQLSKLCDFISYERCLSAFLVDDETLERYAVDIAYYCSVDSIRCQELMIKRDVIGNNIQFAKLTCVTISNVFMNSVGCMVCNFYRRYVSKHDMLISMKCKGIIEISKYEGGLVLEPREFDISDLDKHLNEFSEMLNIPIKDLIKYLDMLGIQLPVADLDFTSMYP